MATTLNQRVKALEAEVARWKARLEGRSDSERWWEPMWGAFAEDDAFQETMRLGRNHRESQ